MELIKENLVIGNPVVYDNENVLNETFIMNIFSDNRVCPKSDSFTIDFLRIGNGFRNDKTRFIPIEHFDAKSLVN